MEVVGLLPVIIKVWLCFYTLPQTTLHMWCWQDANGRMQTEYHMCQLDLFTALPRKWLEVNRGQHFPVAAMGWDGWDFSSLKSYSQNVQRKHVPVPPCTFHCYVCIFKKLVHECLFLHPFSILHETLLKFAIPMKELEWERYAGHIIGARQSSAAFSPVYIHHAGNLQS